MGSVLRNGFTNFNGKLAEQNQGGFLQSKTVRSRIGTNWLGVSLQWLLFFLSVATE